MMKKILWDFSHQYYTYKINKNECFFKNLLET